MAETMKPVAADIAIGIAIMVVVFVAVFPAAGALGVPAPHLALAEVAAAIGIIVRFAIPRRRKA